MKIDAFPSNDNVTVNIVCPVHAHWWEGQWENSSFAYPFWMIM